MEKLKNFFSKFIKKGDIVLIHSDIRKYLWLFRDNFENFDEGLSHFINTLKNLVGEEGTILFPTFNWDFCKGKPFDYRNSPSQVGTLSNFALKQEDFKRTKHPIYSFAVWGKYQKELYNLDNFSSFGIDSPFGFLYKNNGKIILFDVDYQRSFTYVHFVEQQLNVDYRYEKIFKAPYIDSNGNCEIKEYSMFVRDIERGVLTHINPLQKILEDEGIV
ncbi:MAG: AAC(3) family N-acetyltransferase, partial [Nautiliaceae bacterium]